MMGRRDGRIVNLATHRLGDRVQIRDARIENGVLYVDVLQAGADDPACCPGELASLGWELLDGQFNSLVVSETTERFGPQALAGVEWVLHRWDVEEPVAAAQPPTLRVQGNQAGGNAGCNTYGSFLAQEGQPGDMRFGSFTLTRMMCSPSTMNVEARFLASLERAVKVGFLTGRLAVSYLQPDGSLGTLLFERRLLRE
jgi:heat shock protein HslJ